MPAVSKAQLRWVNSPEGHKALGAKGVEEWNKSTQGKKLPERLHPLSLKERLKRSSAPLSR